MTEVTAPERAERRSSPARIALAVLAGLLVIVAPLAFVALDRDDERTEPPAVVDADPLATVRAAVSRTVSAGSYEATVTTTSKGPAPPGGPSGRHFETVSRSVVNFEPYAMMTRVVGGQYVGATTYWNSTRVWLSTGGWNIGGPGTLLSEFARSIVGAVGTGPGALEVIRLATPGGDLNLQQEALQTAAPAGAGTVGDVRVTYFDVSIDLRRLADTQSLTDVQRAAIDFALPLLEQSGYEGTTQRVGVDDDGYIREVRALTRFGDGSTLEKRAIIFNFGCAPMVTMPNEPPAPEAPDEPCSTPPSTTTSTTGLSTTSSTSALTTSVPTAPSSRPTAAPPATASPTPATSVPTTNPPSATVPTTTAPS